MIGGCTGVVCIGATELVRKRVDTARDGHLAYGLMVNAGLIVLALAAFALTRNFWVAAALLILVNVLRSVREPLNSTWINDRIDNAQVRATMFSVTAQTDAVGAIGNRSIRAALLVSALILTPSVPLHWVARQRGRQEPGSNHT